VVLHCSFIGRFLCFTLMAGAASAAMQIDFSKDKPGVYSRETGYGFEPGSTPTINPSGFVSSDKPFYFSIAEPEGNYKVTVTLGDLAGESDTTVKAELRRLMLQDIKTTSGQIITRSFVVNVRTPEYPGGKVHLKAPRENTTEAWAWDDKLTLEFNGSRPCVRSITVEKVDVPTVFLLGDSTVCDQPGEPYASWGQMLPRFFKPDIAVSNNAESGETLRTSEGAHRLDKVLSLVKPGDYVLIQYGHNDMKSKDPDAVATYKATLKNWAEKIRHKGGIPVLITSMNRHTFTGNTVTNSLREYPQMVREAAKEEDVPLIDLNAMSKTLYEALGPTESIALFEHAPGSSKFDATHHSPYGACELAKCVIQGIRDDKLDLAKHILDDVPVFDPAKPDTQQQVQIPTSPAVTSVRPLGD
jgi:lysophospholipase L1-like esterase